MFFLDTRDGSKLSHFMISRPGETVYCSAHLGNAVHTEESDLLVNASVHTEESDLLVNAWYAGGADVIDFNDPAHPFGALTDVPTSRCRI